jgi:hypothetical protein
MIHNIVSKPIEQALDLMHSYHNNNHLAELLYNDNFNYILANIDKDIVEDLAEIYKSPLKNSVEQLMQQIEKSKDWRPLLDLKTYILEQNSKAAIAKIEQYENINDQYPPQPKIEMIKKLNVSFDNIRFRTLEAGDKQALIIGSQTDCCQRIGGAGEASAIDSYINPQAGVLVCEWKNNNAWEILAQSYYHYIDVAPKKGYILDNVEINEPVVKRSGINLNELYYKLATWAKNNLKINVFECGTGYNKLNNSAFGVNKWNEDPRHFEHDEQYSDWDNDKSLNLLDYTPTPYNMKNLENDEDDDEEESPEIEQISHQDPKWKPFSDKYHKKLKEMLAKSKQTKILPDKQLRRQQEAILANLGVHNIPKALSIPMVKTLTKLIATSENTTQYLAQLTNYLKQKNIS